MLNPKILMAQAHVPICGSVVKLSYCHWSVGYLGEAREGGMTSDSATGCQGDHTTMFTCRRRVEPPDISWVDSCIDA